MARIRAVLRRTRGEIDDTAALRFEDLELDEDSHEVLRGTAGRSTSHPRSSSCCATSCSTPTACCRRPRSSTTSGTTTSAARAASCESYISYLRRKIDIDGVPPLIHTKRGVGYVLRRPPAA